MMLLEYRIRCYGIAVNRTGFGVVKLLGENMEYIQCPRCENNVRKGGAVLNAFGILTIFILTLLFSTANAATIYKHIAKDGRVTYSSTPPALESTKAIQLNASKGRINDYGNKSNYLDVKGISTNFLRYDGIGNTYFSVNAFYLNKTNQEMSVTFHVKSMDGLGHAINEYYLEDSVKAGQYSTASYPDTVMSNSLYRSIKTWKVLSTRVTFNSKEDELAALDFIQKSLLTDFSNIVESGKINSKFSSELNKDIYKQQQKEWAQQRQKYQAAKSKEDSLAFDAAKRRSSSYQPPKKLFMAIAKSDLKGVQHELSKVINLDIFYGKKTPLILAAFHGNVQIITALLNAGANPDKEDYLGKTALFYAAESGQPEAVKIMLQRVRNKNHRDMSGNTALMYVALNGTLAVAKALVEGGVIITLKDKNGRKAEEIAARNNSEVSVYLYYQEHGEPSTF